MSALVTLKPLMLCPLPGVRSLPSPDILINGPWSLLPFTKDALLLSYIFESSLQPST